MTTKYGFTKMNVVEFKNWFHTHRIGRLITRVQQHHTYIPGYTHFNGTNHFELQRSMREEHVNRNGWRDIGQHFTIFPDGRILTGRDLELNPACIYGNNEGSICIENLGYFDIGYDNMTYTQRDTIIEVTAAICKKLNLSINTDAIVYHHWFRLDNGRRNNGAGGNKTCPGTNFFGGNKVADCEENFLPLINAILTNHNPVTDDSNILKYVIVTADFLNVRESFSAASKLAADRSPVQMGSILRVYAENDGWLKISNSQNHWVSGRHTDIVNRYIVNTTTLNVRSGPNTNYPKIGQIYKNEQVFIIKEEGNWAKIAMDNRWVSNKYLDEF